MATYRKSSKKMIKPKRSNYKKKSNIKTLAKKVMSIVDNKADKKQSPDQVFNQKALGNFNALSGGVTYNQAYFYEALNVPGAGTGDTGRIGNKIHLTGAQLRLQIFQKDPTNNTSTGAKIRCMVFSQKGPFSGAPDVALLLNYDPVYLTYSYLSDRNNEYFGQFKVYYDKTFTMRTKNTNAQFIPLDLKINLRLNHDQHFYGTGVSAVVDNQMYLLIMSDIGNTGVVSYVGTANPFPVTGANTGLLVNGSFRSYYTDV